MIPPKEDYSQSRRSIRKWVGIKYGFATKCLQDNEQIRDFFYFLQSEFDKLEELDSQPWNIIFTEDFSEIQDTVFNLSRVQLNPIPVLFLLVDGFDENDFKKLQECTQTVSYVFGIRGFELEAMMKIDDYSEIIDWCHAFMDFIFDRVKKNQLPNGERERISNEPGRSQIPSLSDAVPEDVHEVSIEDILNVLDEYNSNDHDKWVQYISKDGLYKRIGKLFQRTEDNFALLRILELALSKKSQSDATLKCMYIILEVISSTKFIIEMCYVCDDFLKSASETSENMEQAWMCIENIMRIFISAKEHFIGDDLAMMEHSWDVFLKFINSLPNSFWNNIPNDLNKWLDTNVRMIKGEETCSKPNVMKNYAPTTQLRDERSYRPSNKEFLNTSCTFWTLSEGKPPPEHISEISEVPTVEDLVALEPPYLRRAVIHKAYDNSEHYLDIMFRLLREDLISPLRDGLHIYQLNGSCRNNRNFSGLSSDIMLYKVLEFEGVQVKFQDGLEFRYLTLGNFQGGSLMIPPRGVLFGQLVCISCDEFRSDFHLGLVVERGDQVTFDGRIGVSFYQPFKPLPNTDYVLADPSSYFEAYHHVLKVIKNKNRYCSFPLERYLVYCKKDILKPLYMRLMDDPGIEVDVDILNYYVQMRDNEIASNKRLGDSPEDKLKKVNFVLHCAHPIFRAKKSAICESNLEKIRIFNQIYNINSLDEDFNPPQLDSAQRSAMISALTKELAIIQGPPGTGKTFIGIEIVRSLLASRQFYGNTTPILLVCYTNTALDQFLEKVFMKISVDMEQGILFHDGPIAVRLGSKSESELVERMRLLKQHVVQDYKEQFAQVEEGKFGRLMGDKRKKAFGVCTLATTLKLSKERLLSFDCIRQAMSEKHAEEFLNWNKKECSHLSKDEAFASWLLDKPFNKISVKTEDLYDEESDSDFEDHSEEIETNEEALEELFRKINVDAANSFLKAQEKLLEEECEFENSREWDMQSFISKTMNEIKLFGKKPDAFNKHARPLNAEIVNAIMSVEDTILKTAALQEKDLEEIVSVLSITKIRRWELYVYWTAKLRAIAATRLPIDVEDFKRVCAETKVAQIALDAKVMRRSLVIGATTTGAAKAYDLLEKLGCQVLIVEESAEVLEAHTFSSISSSIEHMILIGDHQQLKPNPAVYELGKTYHLNVSLFERLIDNGLPYTTLETQHRMNSLITSTIVKPHFYNMLKDHDSVLEYPSIFGMARNLFFWAHREPEMQMPDSNSYRNNHEISMVLSLLQYLKKQERYDDRQITVLATYSAQYTALSEAVSAMFGLNFACSKPNIAVETVDSFQGKENVIVIVSLVRSYGDTIGFLGVPNRICVALTRAKHGMYIIGNMEHLQSFSSLWQGIMANLIDQDVLGYSLPIKCQTHGTLAKIQHPSDFAKLSPEGGCTEICGTKLDCGHVCSRRCHPGNIHLESGSCMQQCLRTCGNPEFNHRCRNSCSDPCGTCNQLEVVSLKCGHELVAPCSQLTNTKCKERCKEELACGHHCGMKCGEECTTECLELMPFTQDCGHTAEYICSLPEVGKCRYPCEKFLPCGHMCQSECGFPCTTECSSPVDKLLECGHLCTVPCSLPASYFNCDVIIEITIDSCGHRMKVKCSDDPSTFICSDSCRTKLDCGHKCCRSCGQCAQDSQHACAETCGKILQCGHVCFKNCGLPCGACKADCLTSCSHQSCGTGNTMSFGRACSDPCVLCIKTCDNSCIHRSCSKSCWQVCDVKPCEQPCEKQLNCGHGCLGMCNEVCPAVCGTCKRSNYLEVVNVLQDANVSKIHRLITISCGHTFPVQYLDEIYRGCKQDLVWPRCPSPRCGRAISGVFRYARIIKKIVLERYKINETASNLKNNLNDYDFKKFSSEVLSYFNPVKAFNLNSKVERTRQSLVLETFVCLNTLKGCDNGFLWNLSRSVECFTRLYSYYLEYASKIPRKPSSTYNVERICSLSCEDGRLRDCVENAYDETLEWIRSRMTVGISGIFMPTMKICLYKVAFYMAVCKLITILVKNNGDLNATQTTKISSFMTRIKDSNTCGNIETLYSKLVCFIKENVKMDPVQAIEWDFFEKLAFPTF